MEGRFGEDSEKIGLWYEGKRPPNMSHRDVKNQIVDLGTPLAEAPKGSNLQGQTLITIAGEPE